MIALEKAEHKANKFARELQRKYRLTHGRLSFILLEIGADSLLKDLTTLQLNGNKIPYLVSFHLRQGIKYYQQYFERQQ